MPSRSMVRRGWQQGGAEVLKGPSYEPLDHPVVAGYTEAALCGTSASRAQIMPETYLQQEGRLFHPSGHKGGEQGLEDQGRLVAGHKRTDLDKMIKVWDVAGEISEGIEKSTRL